MSSFVFIDSRIADFERLVSGVGADVRVVVLDAARDGITQIAEALAGVSALDSIHVISHGASGTLYLGSTVLTEDALHDYEAELAQIGEALSDDGDVLLYGCDVGAGAAGERFVDQLARYTGSDVAASNDATGSAALGGDWALEVSNGAIESTLMASADARATYAHTLATITGDAGNNTLIGTAVDDTIAGLAGHDYLAGAGGNDRLEGGAGNDTLVGGVGNDYFFDPDGNNVLDGRGDNDVFDVFVHIGSTNAVTGGTGRDFYDLNPGSPSLLVIGATGNDYVVTDFRPGVDGDQIYIPHLTDIAVGYTGGDPFDPALGFLRLTLDGSDTLLQGDRDGVAGSAYTWMTLIRLNNLNPFTLTPENFPGLVTGGAGDDSVGGTSRDDILVGAAGNDTLEGGSGDDTVDGGDGDDVLRADVGDDRLIGGGGNDVLNGGVGADSMVGGEGDDVYYVADANDVVLELPDALLLTALAGLVSAQGSGGTDLIRCLENAIDFTLENLPDIENLILISDTLIFGTGNNSDNEVSGNANDNILVGLAGDDTLIGRSGIDTLMGGVGNDTYVVTGADVVVEAGSGGDDEIQTTVMLPGGLAHSVEILRLVGAADIDATGNELPNTIYANRGDNVLKGGSGIDMLSYQYGATSGVTVRLAVENIQNTGGSGLDALSEFEQLTGSRYADKLTGDSHDNVIKGGGGNDVIQAGLGNDTLAGGTGRDNFSFATALDANGNVDLILSFNLVSDSVRLDDDIFTGLATGNLPETAFYKAPGASAANDATDRIIYNSTTGDLYYDSDGVGGTNAKLFATLTSAPGITVADFFVVA